MTRWRRVAGLDATDLGDELLVHDRAVGRVHVLNGTAREIWNLCDGKRSEEAVAREIAARYSIEDDRALPDTREALAKLAELGLLES